MKIDDNPAARAAVPDPADRARKRRPPLTCCDCGKRIFTSLEGFQEHVESPYRPAVQAWHNDCRAPWLIA